MARFVPNGQGKGWAKGRTAATDPRIAKNAEMRRGMTYLRHLSPEHDRRYRNRSARQLPLEWSDTMAYVVGLMATDGNLSGDGRHLAFDSGDLQLIETFQSCLGMQITCRSKRGGFGGSDYQLQFSDVRLHRWLQGIGLTPRKSLTLGALDVPDEFLFSAVRGLFDGDGHIENFVHRPTLAKYPNYQYERLRVHFNSASREHLEWIQSRVAAQLAIRGYMQQLKTQPGRHDFFRLGYAKHGSVALLRAMYPRPDVPKLERKWKIWETYARRNDLA